MNADTMRMSHGKYSPPVNAMSNLTDRNDDDMPAEIDFSTGTRGQFFQPQVRLNLPVYLEVEVETYLAARAKIKGIDVSQLVNELLKKDIELIEAAR